MVVATMKIYVLSFTRKAWDELTLWARRSVEVPIEYAIITFHRILSPQWLVSDCIHDELVLGAISRLDEICVVLGLHGNMHGKALAKRRPSCHALLIRTPMCN